MNLKYSIKCGEVISYAVSFANHFLFFFLIELHHSVSTFEAEALIWKQIIIMSRFRVRKISFSHHNFFVFKKGTLILIYVAGIIALKLILNYLLVKIFYGTTGIRMCVVFGVWVNKLWYWFVEITFFFLKIYYKSTPKGLRIEELSP